jgi:hypothetical protein
MWMRRNLGSPDTVESEALIELALFIIVQTAHRDGDRSRPGGQNLEVSKELLIADNVIFLQLIP